MSTEFKHTPGPWEVFYPDTPGWGLGIDTADSKTSIVVFDDEAGVYGAGEQDEANARLIAAAPEMLEALIDAYMVLYGGNSASIQEALSRAPFNTTPLDFKMMVAIKKATGQ